MAYGICVPRIAAELCCQTIGSSMHRYVTQARGQREFGTLQVFYREHAAGSYSKMPFAVSLCCVEIPYNTVSAALFSCVSPLS